MPRTIKKLIYHEKYHDNCHDYLKSHYLEKYALKKYKELLYDISIQIPKIMICNEMPTELYGDTIVCDQHAVVFSHSKDIYPVVATYALNACVGLVMYVPKYRVASLAHIDGLPGYSKDSAIQDGVKIDFSPVYENLTIILEHLRKYCNTNETLGIDYYLIGGIFDMSEIMISDIITAINDTQNNNHKYIFNFRGRNILGPENQSRNICLNTQDGKIYYFDYHLNASYHHNFCSQNGLPFNIIKAPRNSEAFLDITYTPKISITP